MTKKANDPKGSGTDFGRYARDLGVDFDAVMASQRKNFEALGAANRIAVQGAQAVFRRQTEILQQGANELGDAVRNLSEVDSPQEYAARQADLAKKNYQTTLGNMRDLGEMVTRSNAEWFDLVSKRFADNLDEVRAMFRMER